MDCTAHLNTRAPWSSDNEMSLVPAKITSRGIAPLKVPLSSSLNSVSGIYSREDFIPQTLIPLPHTDLICIHKAKLLTRAAGRYLKAHPPPLQPQSQETTEAKSQQVSESQKAHLLCATAEPSSLLLAHPSWPAAGFAPCAAAGKAQAWAPGSRTREGPQGIHVTRAPSNRKGRRDRRDQDKPK